MRTNKPKRELAPETGADDIEATRKKIIGGLSRANMQEAGSRVSEIVIEKEAEKLAQSIRNLLETEREKYLNWWKSDIASGFIPKCSFCGRKTAKVVGQLPRGKSAQEHNELPRNWMYYCQRCYDEGSELEREAMYG